MYIPSSLDILPSSFSACFSPSFFVSVFPIYSIPTPRFLNKEESGPYFIGDFSILILKLLHKHQMLTNWETKLFLQMFSVTLSLIMTHTMCKSRTLKHLMMLFLNWGIQPKSTFSTIVLIS